MSRSSCVKALVFNSLAFGLSIATPASGPNVNQRGFRRIPVSVEESAMLLSIIIPIYNEAESLPALIARVRPVVENIGCPGIQGLESASGVMCAELLVYEKARTVRVLFEGMATKLGM